MINDKTLPKEAPGPDEGERPEIYAVKNQKDGAGLSRRSFLGAMAAAGAMSVGLTKCGGGPASCGPTPAHEKSVHGLFTLDDTLFSWGLDFVKAWSWTKGDMLKRVPRHLVVRDIKDNSPPFPILFQVMRFDYHYYFAADGEILVTFDTGNYRKVEIWRLFSGEPLLIRTLPDPKAETTSLGLSADGKTMALGKEGGLIEVWNLGGEGPRQTIQAGAQAEISSVLFIDDDILLSGTSIGTLQVWSLVDEKIIKTIKLPEKEPVSIKAVTPGGDLVVAESAGDLSFVSLKEDKEVGRFVRKGEAVRAASLSPDGKRLAVGCSNNIYLLDMKNFSMLGCLFDPDWTEEGTEVSRGRLMAVETGDAPCETPLPAGAACLCDCVGANHTYEAAVCSCDTISWPKGHKVEEIECVCDMVSVGTKRRAPSCSCDSHVSSGGGGGHYWKPN